MEYKLNIEIERPGREGEKERDVIYRKTRDPQPRSTEGAIRWAQEALESERKALEPEGWKIVDAKLHETHLVKRFIQDP